MVFRNLTKKQVLFILIAISIFFVIWAESLRDQVMNYFMSGTGAKLIFYFLIQYGLIILFYYATTKDLKKTIAFAIVVMIIWDLTLGLPFVYTKEGLKGQQLSIGTEYSDDVIIGNWLEEKIYGCSSSQSALPVCTDSQTLWIYRIITMILPILSLFLIFLLLHYRTTVSLLKEGL